MTWKVITRAPLFLEVNYDRRVWAYDLTLERRGESIQLRVLEDVDARSGNFTVGTPCRINECPPGRELDIALPIAFSLPEKIPFVISKV